MALSLKKSFVPVMGATLLSGLLAATTPFDDARAEGSQDVANANSGKPPAAAVIVPVSHAANDATELEEAYNHVGTRDSRTFRKAVIRAGTANASNNAIAVAVYGHSQEFLDQTILAVYDAKKDGIPVVGVVIGTVDEPRGYDVYADGFRVTGYDEMTFDELSNAMKKLNGENLDIRQTVRKSIEDAHEQLQRSLALAKAGNNNVAVTAYPSGRD